MSVMPYEYNRQVKRANDAEARVAELEAELAKTREEAARRVLELEERLDDVKYDAWERSAGRDI